MKRKNATRSALVTSILALLVCVSMLVGATFAWFTDSVASGLNTIAAGNLDVELYHSDKDDSGYVDASTELFNDVTLWEPGVVVYENFKVENVGTLALKYQLSINFENETKVTVDGVEHGLSEVLKVAVVENGFTGGRAEAQNLTFDKSLSTFTLTGELEGNTTSKTYGIVIYWAPNSNDVDNIFNMNNANKGKTLSIDLGINLLATQEMYEDDSFGPDYDKDAWVDGFDVFTAQDLQAAINNGETAIDLMADIETSESIVIPAGADVTINLNGKTLSAKGVTPIVVDGNYGNGDGKLTLIGDGKVDNHGGMSAIDLIRGGDLTVNGGQIESDTDGVYDVDGNSTIIINGGSVTAESYNHIAIGVGSGSTATISGGTLKGEYAAVNAFEGSTVSVTGGTLNGIYAAVLGENVDDVTITGGTFNTDPSAYVADGFKVVESDGLYHVIAENAYMTLAALQAAIDSAKDGDIIVLAADITGDVKVTQKPDVKITIDGAGHTFAGVLTVDGKSATYTTAGLTIKNVNFKADSISEDACVRLGVYGDNNTRYTCNVTVENCTFDVPGAVGVKSYTGGDKNLTIKGCTATASAHSLVQAKGIDGILVDGCKVYSKNGMNFNNSDNVTVSGCTVDVKGYAVRYGESSGGVGAAETYLIENSTLKSACDDGDAVIVLRGTADYATLTVKNTTLDGTKQITNTATGAKVIIDGVTYVFTTAELQAALNAAKDGDVIVLGADITGTVALPGNSLNITIDGANHTINGAVNLNGASNKTLKNIKFDAAGAVYSYDGKGNAKQYANIITGDSSKPAKGARNLVIDGCTFTGTFANGGVAIAFTDQSRTSGQSGDITIKGCTFETTGNYVDIYTYYSGSGEMIIEGNTFKSDLVDRPIYLGRYQSSTPVVIKDNNFQNKASIEAAVFLQDHSSYGVSYTASGNTFAS